MAEDRQCPAEADQTRRVAAASPRELAASTRSEGAAEEALRRGVPPEAEGSQVLRPTVSKVPLAYTFILYLYC